MASVFPDSRREQFLEKSLPSSEESERVILGAILLDNAVIAQAVEHLKPEDFYSPLNRRVFAAMIALFEKQKQIDPILIGEELKKAVAENSGEDAEGSMEMVKMFFAGMSYKQVYNFPDRVIKKNSNELGELSDSDHTLTITIKPFDEEQQKKNATVATTLKLK